MTTPTSDDKYLSIMTARARRLAAVQSEKTTRAIEATVTLCAVGPELIGIPVEVAEEVIRTPAISPLPGLPPWLEGITQIRGEIVSVVSLAKWFGVEAAVGEYSIVVSGPQGGLALLVNAILEFRAIYKDELTSAFNAHPDRPIRAMTRDLVAVLDPNRLFASPALVVSAQEGKRLRGGPSIVSGGEL